MSSVLITKICNAIRAVGTRSLCIVCDQIPYQFHRIPYKKILNWFLVEASARMRPDRPWGMPTHLQLEPSGLCNLQCALCPVTEGMNRPGGYMDPDLFKRLIDEIGNYLFMILLWDWGEPFLNPSIYTMISYARQKGIKIVSSTNGHRLTRPGEADRVIQSGLDSLIVALDGITQETYETFRQKGTFETVIRGVQTLVERKLALNSSTPLINLRFIAMKHNEHELPRLKEFAARLGVNALTVKTLNVCANNNYGDKQPMTMEEEMRWLPSDPQLRRFTYSADGLTRIRAGRNSCKCLWNAPSIHWNGVVCPCTFDYDERFVLGDLRDSSFKDVWNGPAYRFLRSRLRKNDKNLSFCHECSYAYKGGSCINETVRPPLLLTETCNG